MIRDTEIEMRSKYCSAKIFTAALALIACLPLQSGAAGVSQNTTIVEVAIQRQLGNFVLIRTAGPLTGSPACYTNGYWHFTLSLTNPGDRELYAMVMSAFQTGNMVTLTGTGACSEFGSIESIQSLNVLK